MFYCPQYNFRHDNVDRSTLPEAAWEHNIAPSMSLSRPSSTHTFLAVHNAPPSTSDGVFLEWLISKQVMLSDCCLYRRDSDTVVGLVAFKSDAEASEALRVLDAQKLGSNRVYVQFAKWT